MKQREHVSQIMTTEPITLNTTQNLSEARQIFIEKGIHHLPVVTGKRLIGILSYTDVLRIDSGELYKQSPEQSDAMLDSLSSIEAVMTKDPTAIKHDDTVRDAAEILAQGNFHSLPVIENDELTGIITSTDLMKYFLSQY